MDIENILNNFVKELNTAELKFDTLEDGVRLLDQSRTVKNRIEELCGDLSSLITRSFAQNKTREVIYKDYIVKPGIITKFNCNKLLENLSESEKDGLLPLQDLHLNRGIIEEGIFLGILKVDSFEDYIDEGLVTRKVKRYIRFINQNPQDTGFFK